MKKVIFELTTSKGTVLKFNTFEEAKRNKKAFGGTIKQTFLEIRKDDTMR